MKKILLVTSIFLSFFGFAQNGKSNLKWNDKQTLFSDRIYTVPQFQVENYNYDAASKSISYSELIKVNQAIDIKSFKITNVVYENIDINKYKDISIENIPSALQFKISNTNSDGQNFGLLNLNPIIKDGNSFKRIISFDYNYSDQAGFRNTTNNIIGTSNSVLASGEWFKFRIDQNGVYKIDRAFLNQLGIPNSVDPRTIKIYGNGGKPLPLKNSDNLYFDLPEIAIQVEGENDGILNDTDFILFYGKGVYGWDEENLSHLNVYDNNTYYYITYGGDHGKRITNINQPSANATINYNSFEDRVFHEKNLVNIGKLGRKWFGEVFNINNTQNFNFDLPNLINSEPVRLTSVVAASSPNPSSFTFSVNNQVITTANLGPVTNDFYAFERYVDQSFNLNTNSANVSISFNNNGVPSANGYLDYIALDYKKRLEGYDKQFSFRVKDAANQIGIGSYNFVNASSISKIWDISDHQEVKTVATNTAASFSFKAQLGEVKEYLAIANNDFYKPIMISNPRVANQNLKGTIFADGDVDYLILTSPDLRSAAERLAQFHKTKSGLNTKVVLVNTIYEEFSAGKQDISALRNFVRYVYLNASSPDKRVKYLNMFGDTNYDYTNEMSKDNKVPSFYYLNYYLGTTANSHTQTSFVTDDFFVLMDEEEGFITDQAYGNLDIAVARMPFISLTQANITVDKVINYNTIENTGRWKNNYIALADDVDSIGDISLETSLNEMVEELETYKPFFNINKIYTDAYVQEVTSGGPRYPKAKADFLQAINNGALMVNYLGHGGEYGLAQERLLEISDIENLNNINRLPVFAIITCEFTRFDLGTELSGGERLFLKKNAGAVGLFATTRKIYITNANEFTKKLSEVLFSYNSNNYPTIGEALRLTKNQFANNEKAVVFCIGDPALQLAIPKPKVELTHINGTEISDSVPSLRALDLVKLAGNVTDENGNLLSNFNGDLAIQIFDKDIDRKTLANDGVIVGGVPYQMDFKTLGETIFRGNASVENGKFEIEFVVPKDIRIPIGNGKASFYALKNGTILNDYTGYNNTLKIGGVNENATQDNNPPTLQLYMNDETFISGGITNNSPLLLANLEDENGINTASGIGHDMVAILDGNENDPFVLNDYYETEANNFRKGTIKYPFNNLEKGSHTLTVKAWDVYNNLVTSEIQFVVTESESLEIDRVLNYPNPFVDYTEFWFQHNRPTEPLQVQVQILTVTGKIVKTINQIITTDGFLSRDIIWDGKDDFGDRIGKGVYVYKLKVKSTLSGQQAEKIEKLVIL
nr:type IX secretion system sortase PorU [uncultured Flavobacterium sp.]